MPRRNDSCDGRDKEYMGNPSMTVISRVVEEAHVTRLLGDLPTNDRFDYKLLKQGTRTLGSGFSHMSIAIDPHTAVRTAPPLETYPYGWRDIIKTNAAGT